MTLNCPSCNSDRIWRDGIRQTRNGDVQRYLCRECGYRFSETHTRTEPTPGLLQESSRRQIETDFNGSGLSEGHQRIHTNGSYTCSALLSNRQICVTQPAGAKNLAKQIPKTRKAAGATKPTEADIKGKIVEFSWWMKKQGYTPSTIKTRTEIMKMLSHRCTDILDPECVKDTIARQQWSDNRKLSVVTTYTSFLIMLGLTWEPPICHRTRTLPFIPQEAEIDQLIAACGRKLSTALQMAKETAMRVGEIRNLRWTDVDMKTQTVRVTPEKGSNPRIFRVSQKLIGMINNLPRVSQRVFGDHAAGFKSGFFLHRRRVARKLQNPRILQIHFHTLRHWKATLLYHQTKDIVYVSRFLGHKRIETTMIYIQLEEALFREETDQFYSKVARTEKEICDLIEAGFEYVTELDGVKFFRKRK